MKPPHLVAVLACLGTACSDAPPDGGLAADTGVATDVSPDAAPLPADRGRVDVEANAIVFALGEDSVALTPRLRLNDRWSDPTACTSDAAELSCRFLGGDVVVSPDPEGAWAVRFLSGSAVTLQGVELAGAARLAGATARLSNGFQSWSQSGVVGLAAPLDSAAMERALTAIGDAEVIRDGTGPSWFHSFVAGGPNALVAGVTGPSPFRPWVDFNVATDGVGVRLAAGGTGEGIQVLPGESIDVATWFVELGSDLTTSLRRYGDAVSMLDRDAPPEIGWNSWYDLWSGIDEQAIRANAALASDLLEARPLRIVIDDGWQRAWGDWYPDDGFPSGLDGIAADLADGGIEMGVWLAPLLAHEASEVVTEHPDWFVPGVTWNHLEQGRMRVLDVTHPDAAAHLQDTIRRLVGWGMTLLKIDFLFAGTFEGERAQPVTGMQAYDAALTLIREAAGEDTVLLAVGAPGIPSFPYVESWRVGPDIAIERFDVSWFFLPSEARTIAARWMFCDRVLCDADPALLRSAPRSQVAVGAWIAALTGGAWFLSDDLRDLDSERVDWVPEDAVLQAVSSRSAVPLDLVPARPPERLANALGDHLVERSSHVVPARWRLPDGTTLLLNLGDEDAELDGVVVPARSVGTSP